MSLAAIGAAGVPSAPKLCPVVIQRPMSAPSGRYSGPGAPPRPTLPAATSPTSLSMSDLRQSHVTLPKPLVRHSPPQQIRHRPKLRPQTAFTPRHRLSVLAAPARLDAAAGDSPACRRCHRRGRWPVVEMQRSSVKESVMRVFVAGATGAIGRQLVPRLVAAGHEVHG